MQLAAIRPSKSIDIDKYKNGVGSFGSVYVKEGSDYNRIRVGVFSTKSEADKVKAKIRAAGYGSAYVVTEEGATIKSGTEELFTSRSSSANSQYKIRLAALKNTTNVNRNLLNQYGRVETDQNNGLTIFYLSGFSNLSDAKSVLSNIQGQGYPSAYIVQNRNGVLERVK